MDRVHRDIKKQNRSVLLDTRDGMSEDRLSGVVIMRVRFLFVCVCVCAQV